MKLIPLSQTSIRYAGKYFAQVDDNDYDLVSQYDWCLCGNPSKNRYAQTKVNGQSVLMHRLILSVKDSNVHVDHKDGDGLNNTRINIRLCDRFENMRNKSSHLNSTSKYLGVCFSQGKTTCKRKDGTKKVYYSPHFRAFIWVEGKNKALGSFKVEEDAAKAYDEAAKKYHREFANLNFK